MHIVECWGVVHYRNKPASDLKLIVFKEVSEFTSDSCLWSS